MAEPIGVEQTTRPVTDPQFRAEMARRLRGIQDEVARLTAELHEAMQAMAVCDGTHPDGMLCVLAWHSGPHRDNLGVEWFDQ